jgi:hypothetical protein
MLRKLIPMTIAAAVLAIVVGCNTSTTPAPKADGGSAANPAHDPKADEHAHAKGGHGGLIVAVGQDNYHAEVSIDADGGVDLYILAKDEGRVQEVETQTLTASIKNEGEAKPESITFEPAPQPSDGNGKTSHFRALLPAAYRAKPLVLTVPSITFPDGRYRFVAEYHPDHDGGLPTKVAGSEEEKLYLTPGGKYTEEDIRANGRLTASQKFKEFQLADHAKPNKGDSTCPVTDNRANAKFSWIVGGKTYEFCCPPCVDDFVKEAKEHPENIRNPEDYVKK